MDNFSINSIKFAFSCHVKDMGGIIKFFLLVLLVTTTCCSTGNRVNRIDINSIAKKELTGKLQFIYSSDDNSVICIGSKKNLGQTFSFFVYSLASNKKLTVTYSNVSSVKWDGSNKVMYMLLPGTVEVGDPPNNYYMITVDN